MIENDSPSSFGIADIHAELIQKLRKDVVPPDDEIAAFISQEDQGEWFLERVKSQLSDAEVQHISLLDRVGLPTAARVQDRLCDREGFRFFAGRIPDEILYTVLQLNALSPRMRAHKLRADLKQLKALWKSRRNPTTSKEAPLQMAQVPSEVQQEPTLKEPEGRIRGVTLMRAAMMLNDNDGELAQQAKRRWHRKKQPRLPKPVGFNLQHRQEYLFEPSALCDFIEAAGDSFPGDKASCLKALRKCEISGVRIKPSS